MRQRQAIYFFAKTRYNLFFHTLIFFWTANWYSVATTTTIMPLLSKQNQQQTQLAKGQGPFARATVIDQTEEKSRSEKQNHWKNLLIKGTCSLYLYGAPHVDFLDCEWLLLPGLTLHLRLYRSPNPCALETSTGLDADAVKSLDKTPPVVVIEEASLFVNKIVVSETVKLSIERTLTKSCAVCPYIESSTKAL